MKRLLVHLLDRFASISLVFAVGVGVGLLVAWLAGFGSGPAFLGFAAAAGLAFLTGIGSALAEMGPVAALRRLQERRDVVHSLSLLEVQMAYLLVLIDDILDRGHLGTSILTDCLYNWLNDERTNRVFDPARNQDFEGILRSLELSSDMMCNYVWKLNQGQRNEAYRLFQKWRPELEGRMASGEELIQDESPSEDDWVNLAYAALVSVLSARSSVTMARMYVREKMEELSVSGQETKAAGARILSEPQWRRIGARIQQAMN